MHRTPYMLKIRGQMAYFRIVGWSEILVVELSGGDTNSVNFSSNCYSYLQKG